MPHGSPAYSCSASSHASTFSLIDIFGLQPPFNCSNNMYVATCKEAELDTPLPNGTEDTYTASNVLILPGKARIVFTCTVNKIIPVFETGS